MNQERYATNATYEGIPSDLRMALFNLSSSYNLASETYDIRLAAQVAETILTQESSFWQKREFFHDGLSKIVSFLAPFKGQETSTDQAIETFEKWEKILRSGFRPLPNPQRRLVIGDIVRVGPGWEVSGEVGEIVEINDPWIGVRFPGLKTAWGKVKTYFFRGEHHLEPVAPPPEYDDNPFED